MENIVFWHWWVLGIALLVLEAFVPGAFFLGMGIAAGLVGVVLLSAPGTTMEVQLLIFGLGSLVSIVGWRAYQKRHPVISDDLTLNRRGSQYVGRVFTLVEPIVNGEGKIKVDDTTWRVRGDDCDLGQKVRVIEVEGTGFNVEHAE